MTEILLLLWLADTCKALGVLLGVTATIGTIIYAILWMFHGIDDSPKPPAWAAWALSAMFVLAAVLPSERTLHVAAAARAAHLASETELGELATDVIKEALQRLKSELKEKSK